MKLSIVPYIGESKYAIVCKNCGTEVAFIHDVFKRKPKKKRIKRPPYLTVVPDFWEDAGE